MNTKKSEIPRVSFISKLNISSATELTLTHATVKQKHKGQHDRIIYAAKIFA